jgi:hypothetical protein
LSTQGIESRVSQKRRRKWERSPGIGAHISGQQLMVASMAYVLRRSILPFGSEPAAKVALLALWMLMFFGSSLSGVGRNVLLLLAYLTLPTW